MCFIQISPIPNPPSQVVVPDVPTTLVATPDSSKAFLSWNAPTNDGGSVITDYLVEYNDGITWIIFPHGSTATSTIVTSLTNGQSYDFRVSAENIAGTSAPSNIATTTLILGFVDSFSVQGQMNSPTSVEFSTDGTKMFVTALDTIGVSEYECGISFVVSTCSFTHTFSVAAQDGKPTSLEFNTDGDMMFITGAGNDNVYKYTLTTKFDTSTASFTNSFSVAAQDTGPRGLVFNDDGTIMFVSGNKNDNVYQYTLVPGYDITSATYVDKFPLILNNPIPTGLAISPDGQNMFIPFNVYNAVYHYTLIPFDVISANYLDQYDVSNEESNPRDITFSSDGTKMFVVGFGSIAVNEYNLPSAYGFN